MDNKYQTFADLLYASNRGLQTLGFAFAKRKKRSGRAVLGARMCSLLADAPTLASMRKARRCVAFLYGVGEDGNSGCSLKPDDMLGMKGSVTRNDTIARLIAPLVGKELDYLYPMTVHHPRPAYVAKRKGSA